MKFVDIIIDNKTDHTDKPFTYACEFDEVKVGQKVYVPFAMSKNLREGYVTRVYENLEKEIKGLKNIAKLDEDICLTKEMLDTAAFIKKRYFCRMIDAIKCFVPTGKPSKSGKIRTPYKDENGEGSKVTLTDEQNNVLSKIIPKLDDRTHEIFLLHGVTGSGKTEVYMQAIELTIKSGRTVIMLVPEISLTKQVVERFFGRFDRNNIAVLHSKLSVGERHDEWKRIRNGDARIVIGARSAIFAPLENIGLVILDEEHETSYKSDMTPKYDTLEVAIKRLKAYNGVLLLGSATPSIVSYSRAKDGIYTLLEMTKRYNKVDLPRVLTVDMRDELTSGNRTILSRALYDAINQNLENKKQVILFLNRRGYSTFISCRECGYVLRCPECGISMTYHKSNGKAVCHYCGRTAEIPKVCPACQSRYIKHFGTGTEKVEEFIADTFVGANIARLDLDTAMRKGSTSKILTDFKKGKIDILIGTQIVAKGLDFQNVGLVGVISADVSLNIPDFRSAERTFQLITQAAGRAGRGDSRGDVIIQTYTPEHFAVRYAARQDFQGFYKEEHKLRKLMSYPPYSDIFILLFTAKDEEIALLGAQEASEFLLSGLPSELHSYVFEPQKSALNKESGMYRYQLMLKAPKGLRPLFAKDIERLKAHIIADKKKKYMMSVDINPYSFL